MELFRLSDVQLRRGERLILDISSLSIKGGSLYTLVGDNGAGKTTLLRALSRQLDDYTGSIMFNGQDIQTLNRVAYTRRVQYVFQRPHFLQGSVMRNLLLPLEWRGAVNEDQRLKARSLLTEFDLLKLESQTASSLSGGEAQRLSLARALLLDPDVLLVDEPTANVDEENANSIAAMLELAIHENKTVIVATHDPLFIRQDEYTLRLSRGRVS